MQRVHQIILNDQDDKELSPFVEMSVETIRSKISGSYRLWGREELEELMRNEYGQEVVSAFRKMRPYAYKSNLGRYVLLHQFGGWYFDLTMRIDPMVGEINFDTDTELLAFRELQQYTRSSHSVATSVLWAASPGHPVYSKAIEYVLRNCREEYYGACSNSVSGPNLLGEAMAANRCNDKIMWGDVMELTPSPVNQNKAWVMPDGFILAWNKPALGGDIASLGQKGSNNYNDFWNDRSVYDKSISITQGESNFTIGAKPSKSYNEKIKWLMEHERNPLIPKCVDKLRVKDYVREKTALNICPKTLADATSIHGLYEKVKSNATHPQTFYVKANNDSGGTAFIDNNFDQWIRSDKPSVIEAHRHRPYGVEKGEWFYQHVPYACFTEESIGDVNIMNYRFHCAQGEPRFCQAVRDNNTREISVDPNGQPLDFHFDAEKHLDKEFRKPQCWNGMIEIARKLSKDFQFVRVDLYCKDPDSSSIEGNVFFGELTFAPRAGKTPGEGQKEAGKLLPDFGGEEYLADRLVAIEQKYGGICEGVKRRKVSPHDHRTAQEIERGGMVGGDRMANTHHAYSRAYAKHLRHLDGKKRLVISEFGILRGTGLAMWSDLFPASRIIGFDIDLSHIKENIPELEKRGARLKNIELHEFDQLANGPLDISRALQGDTIDVIVDDGLHSNESILNTIESVGSHLSDEFVYFIEDNDRVYHIIKEKYPQWKVSQYGELTVCTNN